MTLVSSTIPNLVGGVSQQAPAARARNASEFEINTYHSLVTGLGKRPSTEWIAEVHQATSDADSAASHAFETSDGSRFVLVIDKDSDGNARATVVRSDGERFPIDLSGDGGYASGVQESIRETFRFLTVGDTTFILNRSVTPSSLPVPEDSSSPSIPVYFDLATEVDLPDPNDLPVGTSALVGDTDYYIVRRVTSYQNFDVFTISDREIRVDRNVWGRFFPTTDRTRKDPKRSATIYVRQAVHSTDYSFEIEFTDGTVVSSGFKTPDAVNANGDPNPINTDLVVDGLITGFSSVDATASKIGSTISIVANKDIKSVTHKDGFGDQAMRAFGESVQDFSDLPPNETNGRVVRINGDVETGGDDYFVEFQDGIWTETVAFNERTELDPATMPLKLLFNPANTSFSLITEAWPGRTAGSSESNPEPTFVGRVINSMFLFKGRMVFLSDENVLFSEVGVYENFYRTTLTQLLETDPIDVASTNARTSTLFHGVPFDETLVVFSDRQQFRILSGDTLTPQNVAIAPTTSFNCSKVCAPIQAGANVLFAGAGDGRTFSSIMEYYRNPNSEADDAAPVTSAVPRYIPANTVQLKSTANENIVVALTADNSGELYAYRYFWSGQQKVLSSWTTWKISGVRKILSVDFFGDELFALVTDGSNRLHLIKANLEDGATDPGRDFQTLLDLKALGASLVRTYDPVSGTTRVRLPTSYSGGVVQAVLAEDFGDYPKGYIIEANAYEGSTAFFPGDLTQLPVFIGYSYELRYRFSPQYIRQRFGDGEVPIQEARLSYRYFTIYFDRTSTFRTEVTPEGRQTYIDTFTGRSLGDDSGSTDLLPINSESFRFAVRGQPMNITIDLVNETPFPSNFQSVDWTGVYHPKSRRI